MKTCDYCGKKGIPDEAIECPVCGYDISTEEQMEAISEGKSVTAQMVPLKPVKVDNINYATFDRYIKAAPASESAVSFSDWAQREQVILLQKINSKLAFFVFLIILGIIISFFSALLGG